VLLYTSHVPKIPFQEVVKEFRKVAPGRVTVVSYEGLRFARECGIDIISDYAGTLACQHVIHDHGTPEEQQRLREMEVGYAW
jgi:hypothetical protein